MKVTFALVVTGGYIQYAQVLLRSIVNNSGLKHLPIHIIHCNKNEHGYNSIEKDDKRLTIFHDNLIFKNLNYADYIKREKTNPRYWSIEMFNIRGYDRIIYIDIDTLCLKPITDLATMDIPTGLGMCWELHRNQWQAGVMIVDKKFLDDNNYGALMMHQKNQNTFGHDQAVYNEIYGKCVTKLDDSYNTLVGKEENLDDVKILHYIYKADTTNGKVRLDSKLYNLWYDNKKAVDKILAGAL
jgi:lipopolysaccharide biosynthesis glycosyltransferase